MAPSWLKLVVPTILVVCFVPYTRSANVLEVKCPEAKTSCPDYCPKDSRPAKLNPNSAWDAPCICCNIDAMKARSGLPGSEKPKEFKLEMQPKAAKPANVSNEDRQRLLKELEDLKNKKILPYQVFEFWKLKIEQTDKHLLTKDEEELLDQLLYDCGIPLNNAMLLVRPLVEDQALPKPTDTAGVSRRNGFGAKSLSYEDLKKSLENLKIAPKKEASEKKP